MEKPNPSKNKIGKKNRTKCEVWSRVVGYLRPVSRWNEGKVSEFGDRKNFAVQKDS